MFKNFQNYASGNTFSLRLLMNITFGIINRYRKPSYQVNCFIKPDCVLLAHSLPKKPIISQQSLRHKQS